MFSILRFHLRDEPYRGVYVAGDDIDDIIIEAADAEDTSITTRHPSPQSEGYPNMRGDDYCGFTDESQMQQWFPNHHLLLEPETNIVLSEFRVTNRVRLGRQCVFRQSDVISIRQIT